MAFHECADEYRVGQEYGVGDRDQELSHFDHQAEGEIEHQQGNGNACQRLDGDILQLVKDGRMSVQDLLGLRGDLADACPALVWGIEVERRRGPGAGYGLHQLVNALAAHGHCWHHLDTQLFFQGRRLYLNSFVGGHVPEIEGDDRGQAPLQDLQG